MSIATSEQAVVDKVPPRLWVGGEWREAGGGGTFAVEDPATGEVILPRGGHIDETVAERMERAGVEEVYIRSVLTCDARSGVCGLCYGRDLARGTPVEEALGKLAGSLEPPEEASRDHAFSLRFVVQAGSGFAPYLEVLIPLATPAGRAR